MVYDDINLLIELVESYQDTVNSTRELYIANISFQMNDTIKKLTPFPAVLFPLTFNSSIFGMNVLDLNHIWRFPLGFVLVMIIMVAAPTLCVFEGEAMDNGHGRPQLGQAGQADATLIS